MKNQLGVYLYLWTYPYVCWVFKHALLRFVQNSEFEFSPEWYDETNKIMIPEKFLDFGFGA